MNIISIVRFRHWIKDEKLRYASLAAMGAHEFGHNLDLVDRRINIGDGGYKEWHCNGEQGHCIMEQVNVEGCLSIEEHTKTLSGRKNLLCETCSEELVYRRFFLEQNGFRW